jgi:hypothetical protein
MKEKQNTLKNPEVECVSGIEQGSIGFSSVCSQSIDEFWVN